MNVEYVSPNGRLKLGFTCSGVKELITNLSKVTEILEADTSCGQCGSDNISPTVREYEGNSYYSITCSACGGYLQLGQHKTGNTLFVKRDQGKRGWLPKYTKDSEGATQQTQQRDQPNNAPQTQSTSSAEIPF